MAIVKVATGVRHSACVKVPYLVPCPCAAISSSKREKHVMTAMWCRAMVVLIVVCWKVHKKCARAPRTRIAVAMVCRKWGMPRHATAAVDAHPHVYSWDHRSNMPCRVSAETAFWEPERRRNAMGLPRLLGRVTGALMRDKWLRHLPMSAHRRDRRMGSSRQASLHGNGAPQRSEQVLSMFPVVARVPINAPPLGIPLVVAKRRNAVLRGPP